MSYYGYGADAPKTLPKKVVKTVPKKIVKIPPKTVPAKVMTPPIPVFKPTIKVIVPPPPLPKVIPPTFRQECVQGGGEYSADGCRVGNYVVRSGKTLLAAIKAHRLV